VSPHFLAGIRKAASEYPFYILIHVNSCTFHIYFNLFIFLSKPYSIFDFLIYFTLSLNEGPVIIVMREKSGKIRKHIHEKMQTHKTKQNKTKKAGKNTKQNKGGVCGRKGKKGIKRGKKREGIMGSGGQRSVGTEEGRTHTNNARST